MVNNAPETYCGGAVEEWGLRRRRGRTDADVGAEVLSAASGDCGREHQPSPPGIDPWARSALRFDDDTH